MTRRYRLVAKLEESAIAELYKGVVDGAGGQEVLVKLHTPRVSDPAFGRALADINAKVMSLNHPGVQGYVDVGMVQGRIAAVRPFVDGFNLGDALRRLSSKEVVLTPALALFIVAEAAQAVAQAHLQGWIHGALTPGNILLCKDGRVRVVDFGVLAAMNASESLKQLAGKGRHAYRAPEMKTPGIGSPSADVYSLGAIVYELITLREVAGIRGGGLSTKRDGLMPPSRLDRRLNVRLDGPIMRALDTAAPRRYKNAAELSDALRGLFTVLGYAPGSNELLKFIGELFPNEVSVGGVGGPVAFTEPFVVDPFNPAAIFSLPETPAVFQLEERASFTGTNVPAWPSEPAQVAAPPAPAPAEPAPAPSFEEWEAPPGVMPEAPRLNRGRAAAPSPSPAEVAPTIEQPAILPPGQRPTVEATPAPLRNAPTTEAPGLEPHATVTSLEPRPTVTTTETVTSTATTNERPGGRTRRRSDTIQDAAFDADDLDPKELAATAHDWHVPPSPPPPPPPKPKVGIGSWLIAGATFAAIAGVVFLLLQQRLGVDTSTVGKLVKDEGYVPPSLAPTPLGERGQERAEPEPAEKPARRNAPRQVADGLLTVDADEPAQVFIDGRDTGRTTPLTRYGLPPGAHTVLLVTESGKTRELRVELASGEEVTRTASFAEKSGGKKSRRRSR